MFNVSFIHSPLHPFTHSSVIKSAAKIQNVFDIRNEILKKNLVSVKNNAFLPLLDKIVNGIVHSFCGFRLLSFRAMNCFWDFSVTI